MLYITPNHTEDMIVSPTEANGYKINTWHTGSVVERTSDHLHLARSSSEAIRNMVQQQHLSSASSSSAQSLQPVHMFHRISTNSLTLMQLRSTAC